MSNLSARLKQFFTFKGENLSAVERNCGFKPQTFRKSMDRESDIQSDKLMAILATYPELSAEWLLRGTGEMISNPKEDNITVDEKAVNKIYNPKYTEKTIDNEVINLYDIDAAANLKTILAAKGQYILGQIMIPNAPKCDGALYVRGDSMYPLLKAGDIVAYREITPDLQNIFWGEMYVVDLNVDGDDYLVVKYVNQSEKGNDWIKLVSYNQYHQPKDFPISCIRAMALVKLSIRMNTIK